MLAFCNNSGPAFILGVVGAGVFSSGKIGILLYCMHVLASILIGIGSGLFTGHSAGPRMVRRTPTRIETVSFTEAFTNSVKNSFFSTLTICGFVIFFTVVIRMLFLTGVLHLAASGLAVLLGPIGMTEAWAERLGSPALLKCPLVSGACSLSPVRSLENCRWPHLFSAGPVSRSTFRCCLLSERAACPPEPIFLESCYMVYCLQSWSLLPAGSSR